MTLDDEYEKSTWGYDGTLEYIIAGGAIYNVVVFHRELVKMEKDVLLNTSIARTIEKWKKIRTVMETFIRKFDECWKCNKISIDQIYGEAWFSIIDEKCKGKSGSPVIEGYLKQTELTELFNAMRIKYKLWETIARSIISEINKTTTVSGCLESTQITMYGKFYTSLDALKTGLEKEKEFLYNILLYCFRKRMFYNHTMKISNHVRIQSETSFSQAVHPHCTEDLNTRDKLCHQTNTDSGGIIREVEKHIWGDSAKINLKITLDDDPEEPPYWIGTRFGWNDEDGRHSLHPLHRHPDKIAKESKKVPPVYHPNILQELMDIFYKHHAQFRVTLQAYLG